MKLPILLISMMSLLGINSTNNQVQPLTLNAQAETEVTTPRYDLPIDASTIPDDALIGNLRKAKAKDLGLPAKSKLLDYDAVNDPLEFDFMGFHYRRTVNDDGTITNPVRSPILADEESPEEVYLGPVHNSDETKTVFNNPVTYEAYVNTKTAFVYSMDYANHLDSFPNLENIVYLTYDCKLNRNLAPTVKNIYFVPSLGSSTQYFSTSSMFQPSVYTRKVNVIFPEYDKLGAIKLINSIQDHGDINNLDFVMPNFYYLGNDECYTEYKGDVEYYEYGGFYYARSKCVGLSYTYDHVLFPGKYVTKGILDIEKAGLSALQFKIKLTGEEIHYFDELYMNMTFRYDKEIPFFNGNKVYIQYAPSNFNAENLTSFNEYYVLSVSSQLNMNNYEIFNETDKKFYISTLFSEYYTQKIYTQVDYEHLFSFDPTNYVKTLECRNGDKVYTSTELDYSYASSFDTIIDKTSDTTNPPSSDDKINDTKEDSKLSKTQKTVLTVVGVLSGTILIYLLYKIIKKGIRWLKR